MSGIGHFATGFAARGSAPQVPLLVLLAASETNDILYFVFTTVGLEKPVHTTINFTQGVRYLEAVSAPWSHGLMMSVLWALLVAWVASLVYRDRRTAGTMGVLVFSHWVLDFFMHSNLPLSFNGSPLLGLGLENTGAGFIAMTIVDLLMFSGGITLYLLSRKKNGRKSAQPAA